MSGPNSELVFPLGPLLKARFIRRDNRFRAEVELQGQSVQVHVPNSGRMKELLVPGVDVWIQPAAGANRKTAYTLLLVQQGQRFVCLHAHLANDLIAFWLKQGILPGFAAVEQIEREKTYGKSRFDFRLKRQGRLCYAEVKSVNLLDGHTARFPDAPTERGVRHLHTLMRAVEQGHRATVFFVVQMDNVLDFAPNDETHPAFGEALRQAASAGVQVLAYSCHVTPEEVTMDRPVPVLL